MKSNRFKVIDLYKFIACFLVVVHHTKPFHNINLTWEFYQICVSHTAVPFFFCISSFFFWYKSQDIRKYVNRLLTLYLAWFVLELPLSIYIHFIQSNHSITVNILRYINEILFNNGIKIGWYIMASIQSMILVYFLSKKLNNKGLFLVGCGFYAISLKYSFYEGVISSSLIDKILSPFSYVLQEFQG